MRISDWSSDVGSSDLKRQFTWFRHPQIAHHAGFLMFDDVAVEHPVARPAANEGNLHPLVRPHQHGVAPMRAYILFGRGNHPEGMAVQMHRMGRSEEHTSELQSLMRISYAVFCLKKKKTQNQITPSGPTR